MTHQARGLNHSNASIGTVLLAGGVPEDLFATGRLTKREGNADTLILSAPVSCCTEREDAQAVLATALSNRND